MNPKCALLVSPVLLCFPARASAAVPTITSVSGTVQTGQTLTITGANMMSEDMTNWTSFFTSNGARAYYHSNSNPVTDGYGVTNNSGYSTDEKLISPARSLKSTWMGASDDANKHGGAWIDWTPPVGGSGDLWTRAYVRTHTVGGWPRTAHKLWWAGNSPQPSFLNFDETGTGAPPSRLKMLSANVDGGSWSSTNLPDGPWQDDRWYLIEWKLRAGGGAGTNELWVDNQRLLSVATPGDNGFSGGFGWELITNGWGTDSNYVQNFWHDGFTQGTSRPGPASLIEIGNGPDYAGATKVYQPPTRLSETSSQIIVKLTGLGGSPYYLWVTNNRGERSQPYSLNTTLGASPAAPRGLRLQ